MALVGSIRRAGVNNADIATRLPGLCWQEIRWHQR